MPSRTRFIVVAGLVVGGYASVIAWSWWRNVRSMDATTRLALEGFALVMLLVMATVVSVAWSQARRERGVGRCETPARLTKPDSRRRWCRRISTTIIGPFATVLMLSGLYAAVRFDNSRKLPVSIVMLILSAIGFAAYLSCARHDRLAGPPR